MVRKALLTLAVLALASCGHPAEQLGTRPTTGTTAPVNDPAVLAAADKVVPVLEQRFADFYAGVRVRDEVPDLVVYRKPNPHLDAEVTRLAPGARIEFRDARYYLAQMKDALPCAMGVPTVVVAGPAVDGSGVGVTTTGDPETVARELEDRCPAMEFTVEKGAQPVPAAG
ncbi:hypothetical protein [Nocardia sp. NRRL S-836]|uniref:hypothetical protein n=1 Tax=Nocardia sp. NRRL S-836 TaxID=1519492 RepID=UPI0006AE2670|nr:hypothetical protein [Nocardia sp. NRRL S-836]KOV84939.1 hypothetical protein ADL03_11075 [Nocardia sp. NRRL S-836]